MKKGIVAVYSASHFLVDFACALLLYYSVAYTRDGRLCLLLYNFCAFALQMPIGLIADKLNKNALLAAAGCLLVAGAYGLGAVPIAAAVVAGLGNSLFHVGGGVDVLNMSEEKSSLLGIFVSPGAFGIYFGAMLGRQGALPPALMVGLLVLAAAAMLAVRRFWRKALLPNVPVTFRAAGSAQVLAAEGCFFAMVCLRSFVGLTLDFPWKSAGYWGFALICAVVFGKTAGGFAADRFGALGASLVSLGGAAILFLLSAFPVAGVAAVLLFNMTMPITLWAMARLFPGAKGFSFGLLTFALFIGYLPVHFQVPSPSLPAWGFAAAAAVSLVLLLPGLLVARAKAKR